MFKPSNATTYKNQALPFSPEWLRRRKLLLRRYKDAKQFLSGYQYDAAWFYKELLNGKYFDGNSRY